MGEAWPEMEELSLSQLLLVSVPPDVGPRAADELTLARRPSQLVFAPPRHRETGCFNL